MTVFNNWSCSKNTQKAKGNFADNHFHNILRLFDALPNFSSITSETTRDYYL